MPNKNQSSAQDSDPGSASDNPIVFDGRANGNFNAAQSPMGSPCQTPAWSRENSPERDTPPSIRAAPFKPTPAKDPWGIQKGLTFRDILLGIRSKFPENTPEAKASPLIVKGKRLGRGRKPFVAAEKTEKSEGEEDAELAGIRKYHARLTKTLERTKKGRDKLEKYVSKLERRNRNQKRYNERLQMRLMHMGGEGTSEDQPRGVLDLSNLKDETQPEEQADTDASQADAEIEARKAGEKALLDAQRALNLQTSTAEKAKEEAEAEKARAARLEKKLQRMKAQLEVTEAVRKEEKKLISERSEESKILESKIRELSSRLEAEKKEKEAERNKAMLAQASLAVVGRSLKKEREQKTLAEISKEQLLAKSSQLEAMISSMENEIADQLLRKDEMKEEHTKLSKNTDTLRENMAKLEVELAEAALAKAKAESKATEVVQEYSKKLADMQTTLEAEKKIKEEAAKRAVESKKKSTELQKMVDEIELKLKREEEKAEQERLASLRKQEEVKRQADLMKQKADEELEVIKAREVEARKKEEELKKSLEKEAQEKAKIQQEKEEELSRKEAEIAAAAERLAEMQRKFEELEMLRRRDLVVRRKLHNRVQDLLGHVRVYCRIRPVGKDDPEIDFATTMDDGAATLKVVEEKKNATSSQRRTKKHMFTFDHVFGPSSDQIDIFSQVEQLITSSMDGYDVTIFAYGQTGSGKTFTMFGPNDCDYKTGGARGIIPRAIDHIFQTIEQAKERKWSYTMEASIMEIYNEQLNDLLASKPKKKVVKATPKSPRGKSRTPLKKTASKGASELDIKVHKTKKGKVIVMVNGVTKVPVKTPEQLHELTRSAADRATRASTDMNARSSRSHTVFQLHVKGTHEDGKESTQSVLTLVDLAGSERIAKTNASGDRLKEAKAINLSLTLLGNCVRALAEKNKHVPFRGSKLTYLLQGALSGTGKTAVMVNITPDPTSIGESLCTLRFADQLKKVNM